MLACLSCSRAHPANRPARCLDWLTAVPFAHRGLFGPDTGPENTLPAFAAAVNAGYGIECDVRLLADGQAVVFHDRDLTRLTGQSGRIDQLTSADLSHLNVGGTDAHPPLLSDVLSLVAGRTPLYVEIKNSDKPGRLEQAVAGLLAAYTGPVMVASFNPWSLARLSALAPDLPRCLIACNFADDPHMGAFRRFLYANLFPVLLARPQCVAYDWRALPQPAVSFMRRLGVPVLLWTVRAGEDMVKALRYGDNIVFEGFLPESPDATKQAGQYGGGTAQE